MKKLIVSTCLVACLAAILPGQTTYTITSVVGSPNNTVGDGGNAAGATFVQPVGVAIDLSGNLYVTDIGIGGVVAAANTVPSRVRKIDGTTGVISTLTIAATSPSAVVVDADGKFLYVTGDNSHSVWKVDTTTGATTRYAGTGSAGNSGDGHAATTVRMRRPQGVWRAPNGDIYVTDTLNNRIHRVDATTGFMYQVAGRGTVNAATVVTGTAAAFPQGDGDLASKAILAQPVGVVGDKDGNLYFADLGSNRIRKVDAATGIITTVVGLGTTSILVSQGGNCTGANPANCTATITIVDAGDALRVTLNAPTALAWDKNGNLLIADTGNNRIRSWNLTTNQVTTIAGGGNRTNDDIQGATSILNGPTGIAVDATGNIFIADSNNGRIRKIDIATGIISTFSGANQGRGDGAEPQFATTNNPRGVAVAPDGTIYFSDTKNNKVRKVSGGIVSTVAGTGTGGFTFPENATANSARLSDPGCLATDSAGNVFIADRGNARIRKLDTSGNLTTVAGSTNLTTNAAGVVTGGAVVTGYYNDGIAAVVSRVGLLTGRGVLSAGSTANFTSGPSCVTVDNAGNLFIADTGNHVVRKVDTNGIITTAVGYVTTTPNAATGISTNAGVAGAGGDGGQATNAQLNGPMGVGVNPSGTLLCVADTGNHMVRLVNLVNLPAWDAKRTCVALNGTAACTGLEGFPTGVKAGTINNIAGISNDGGSDALPANGWQSRLNTPTGCAVDDKGNVFITDTLNLRITTVNPAGQMSIIAGTGTNVASDGRPALQAQISLPAAINLDSDGNILFTNRLGLIQKLTPTK